MERPEETRLLIADDHKIFCQGLRALLEGEPGFVVIGEASNGEDAVRLARELTPDVLLLDVAMPGASGLDALAELAAAPTPVRTILLTAGIDKPDIVKALQLGASGVVLKSAAADLLFKSIRSVMAGQHWIGREAVTDLVQALRSQMTATPQKPAHERFGLTARELEITSAIVDGLRNKEIAQQFSLSEDTVKHHLTRIYNKMGASNRLELALFAVHHRLFD